MSKIIRLITVLVIPFLILSFCSSKLILKKVESEKLVEKIELMEIINKDELNQLLGTNLFKQYNDKFMGTGDYKVLNDIYSGVIIGIKNDTIFDISFASRNNDLLMLKENPKSTIYYKNGAIIEEYIIGRTYTIIMNDTCVTVNFEKFIPLKIDTMKNKFSYLDCKIMNSEFFEVCND